MQLKFARATGRIVAVGALAAAGLGFTQAALAGTALAGTAQAAVSVPCSAAALASAIGGASSGETLSLAKFCVYKLTEALPDVDTDLTINGNQSTIERSYATNTADFTILTVEGEGGDVVLNGVSFRNGGGTGDLGGPILGPKAGSIRNGGDETDGGAIHNEGDLTDVGRFPCHVRPRNNGESQLFPIKLGIVRNEFLFHQILIEHRMPAIANC